MNIINAVSFRNYVTRTSPQVRIHDRSASFEIREDRPDQFTTHQWHSIGRMDFSVDSLDLAAAEELLKSPAQPSREISVH